MFRNMMDNPADVELSRKERTEIALGEFDKALAFIDAGHLKVRTRGGGMVVFKPKWFQKKLYAHIRNQMAKGRPVKIAVLKSRQMGISTAIAMLFMALSITRQAVVTMVTAHEKKSADKIFEIYRRALRNLPEEVMPKTRFDSMRHTVFEGSETEIGVEIAVHGKLGRSDTVTYAHYSEFAWWEEQRETLQAAMSAVPETVGTIQIIETTANGWGDPFHELWLHAEKAWEENVEDWEPFFLPWFQEPEYHKPLPKEYEQSREENEIQTSYKLARTQVYWRRHKLATDCGNDESLFDREFPATPTHAFRTTGDSVFDQKGLEWQQIHHAEDPIGCFDVGVTLDGRPFRRLNAEGFCRIYREPIEGREYIIAADPTHNVGLNPDDAAAHVFDVQSREQVAAYSGPIGADEFGDVLTGLARLYNNAYVVVETNIGVATVSRMYQGWGYANIHWFKPFGAVDAETSWQMGYRTTPTTRADSIHVTKRLIVERLLLIRDRPTIAECQQFKEVKKGDKKKAQAPKGKQDNLVMALCILSYVANERYRWISLENYLDAIQPVRPVGPRYPSKTIRQVERELAKERRRKQWAGAFGVGSGN